MFFIGFNESARIGIIKSRASKSNLFSDSLVGVCSWFLAFPIVVVIGQLSDMLIYAFFGVETYEQVAVSYLKMALESPTLLFAGLLTIIISAPILEEFLFRGLLQTYLKKYVGRKTAILIASFFFAFFHLNASQGAGNVSLFFSLLFLGAFLGFIYERQGSLLASISLHITFNAISVLRVLLF